MREHCMVELVVALPEHRLAEGAVGTVVHVHRGGEAYEVEFPGSAGSLPEVLTLAPDLLRAISRREALRRLTPLS